MAKKYTRQDPRRVCARCSVDFLANHGTTMYCSTKCKKAVQGHRKRSRPRSCRDCSIVVPKGRQYCQACLKKRSYLHGLKKTLSGYGLTHEAFSAMVTAQGGACRICSHVPPSGARLVVDHCHATGKVRALLCSPCNTAIGLLRENPAIIQSAAQYVSEFSFHQTCDASQ